MSETIKLVAMLKDNLSGPLGRTGRNLKKFGRTATQAAMMVGVLATAVLAAAKKLADYGAAIQDMSDFSGIGVEALQGLTYGIEQAGGSAQNLSMALRTQARFIGYLEQGVASYTQYLDDLGITYEQLEGLSPEETFLTISDALANVQDEVKRTEIGMVAFGGRGMSAIISGLEQFDGSLRNAQDQFEELGGALSGEQVANLKAFSDAMLDLQYEFRAFIAEAIVPLLPMIEDAGNKFLDVAEDKLPKLIEAAGKAIPVLIGMVDVLALAAEGWDKLIGGDIDRGIDDTTTALTNMATGLQAAVDAGMIPAEQAMQDYIRESNNMIEASTANAANAAILRSETQGLAVDFDFARSTLLNLLNIMDTSAIMTDLGNSFQSAGEQIVGMLVDTDMLGAALAELTIPEIDLPTSPGTGTPEDMDNAKNFNEFMKNLTLERIAEEEEAQLGAITRREDSERDAIAAGKQRAIAALEEIRAVEAAGDAEQLAKVLELNSLALSGAQEIGSEMLKGVEGWEERALKALAKMAIMAAAIAIGGPFGAIIGFVGGLFQSGGKVHHAQGGEEVSGPGIFGDRQPYLLEQGERVTKREQVINDRLFGQQAKAVMVNVNLNSTLSTASPGDAVRAGKEINRILKAGGY